MSKFILQDLSWSTNQYFPCLTAIYALYCNSLTIPPTEWQQPCLFLPITDYNCSLFYSSYDITFMWPDVTLWTQVSEGRINPISHKASAFIVWTLFICHMTSWSFYCIQLIVRIPKRVGACAIWWWTGRQSIARHIQDKVMAIQSQIHTYGEFLVFYEP